MNATQREENWDARCDDIAAGMGETEVYNRAITRGIVGADRLEATMVAARAHFGAAFDAGEVGIRTYAEWCKR